MKLVNSKKNARDVYDALGALATQAYRSKIDGVVDESFFTERQKEWRTHMEQFPDLLHRSAVAATQGAVLARQFREITMVRIESTSEEWSFERKKQELNDFISDLSRKEQVAAELRNDFLAFSTRMGQLIENMEKGLATATQTISQKFKAACESMRQFVGQMSVKDLDLRRMVTWRQLGTTLACVIIGFLVAAGVQTAFASGGHEAMMAVTARGSKGTWALMQAVQAEYKYPQVAGCVTGAVGFWCARPEPEVVTAAKRALDTFTKLSYIASSWTVIHIAAVEILQSMDSAKNRNNERDFLTYLEPDVIKALYQHLEQALSQYKEKMTVLSSQPWLY